MVEIPLSAGSNVSFSYDEENNELKVNADTSGDAQLTDEEVQDIVSNLIVGGGSTTVTYDDANNALTIESVDTDTTDHSQLTNIQSGQHHSKTVSSDLESGGSDELSVTGLSGDLADAQDPKTHDHSGGTIAPSELSIGPDGPFTSREDLLGVQGSTGNHTASGDGSTTSFQIPHGLSVDPVYVDAVAKTTVTSADYTVSHDATNITVEYAAAPPDGTDNLNWEWIALSDGVVTVGDTGSTTEYQPAYTLVEGGSTTLSNGEGAVTTNVPVDTTSHFDVNLSPPSGADVAASLENDGTNYVINIEENTTNVGNPAVGWQFLESNL